MEKNQTWKIISNKGKKFKKNLAKIANKNRIKISIQGLDAMPKFDFEHTDREIFTTFLSQEMLKKKNISNKYLIFLY